MNNNRIAVLAGSGDLPELERIFAAAREYMVKTGNPTQWPDGYPQRQVLEEDIAEKRMYLVRDILPGGEYVNRGAFVFAVTDDPNYAKIDGGWKDDSPYAVLHRIASDGSSRGVFSFIVEFAKSRYPRLRIDTGFDNKVMQKLILAAGFKYCGVIYIIKANGSPRYAYELIQPEEIR
ncbi:MAG: N-acetyltransferase [Eubacteriales bacterium]|jgi:hypothetical protein